MLNKVMAFIVRHPLWVIFLSVLFCGLAFAGLGQFRIDNSVKHYIGADNKIVVHLNRLEQEYVEDSNVLVMLKPRAGSIFTESSLRAVYDLTEAAWSIPGVRRVDSMSNFQHTEVDGDLLQVADLIADPDALDEDEIQRIRAIALAEPRLAGALLAVDGGAAGVNLSMSVDIGDRAELAATISAVNAMLNELRLRHPNMDFVETGYVWMMSESGAAAERDVKVIYSGSLLLILLFLYLFFRSLRAAVAVLSIGVLSVLTSLGLFAALGGYLTPPTVMGTLMVLILGVADGIHVVKSASRFLAEGERQAEAIRRSIDSNFLPIALTSVTTAVGFLSFNLNDYVGIKMLGNYVAIGVMVAFLLTLTLLPALLFFCALKPSAPKWKNLGGENYVAAIAGHRRSILSIAVLAVALAAILAASNRIDDSISRHLKPEHPFRQNLSLVEQELGGSSAAIYNFAAKDGVSDPEFMAKVDAFAAFARQQPGVRHVSVYTDTLKQLNQDMHGGDPSFYRLPASRQLAAQYLLLYELQLPYGLDLTNQINIDKTGARVVISINDLSLEPLRELLLRNKAWLADRAPGFDSFANSAMLASNLTVEGSIQNTLAGALVALLVIAVFLFLTFRALFPTFLCMLAVVVPVIITFGLWRLGVGILDLPGTLAMCMVIGISVDFGVHLIAKYLNARRLGMGAAGSLDYALSVVAIPIITSTLALGSGFLLMMLGEFQFSARMGLLTALCIGFSAVTVFVILPALILMVDARRSSGSQ